MASKLNREWHAQNKLKKNASEAERVRWHIEHAKHCGCREMPESIRKLVEKHENQH